MGRQIDETVLEEAADDLHHDHGSLMDLPEELRNTIASVYYEVHWTRRHEGAMPLVAHLRPQKGRGELLDAAMKQFILRMAQYQHLSTYVEMVREADKETQPNLYAMLTKVVIDALKWNIDNAIQKSAFRRSLERLTKKPVPEVKLVPARYGLYSEMRNALYRREQDATLSDDDTYEIVLGPEARITRGPVISSDS